MIRRITHAVLISLLGLAILTLGSALTGSAASAEAVAAPASTKESQAARPKLRAGINEQQLEHAVKVVEAGQELELPRRAYVVAIATALQESRLEVLANVNVPDSFDHQPRDGYGQDHDSVGLFQQRVQYYCTDDVKHCMDPHASAIQFYNGLEQISDWEELPVTVAAQRVQGSAFPDYYAQHQGAAEVIVDSVLDWKAID